MFLRLDAKKKDSRNWQNWKRERNVLEEINMLAKSTNDLVEAEVKNDVSLIVKSNSFCKSIIRRRNMQYAILKLLLIY